MFPSQDGDSALTMACSGGHKEMVEFMLSVDADKRIKNKVSAAPTLAMFKKCLHLLFPKFNRKGGTLL